MCTYEGCAKEFKSLSGFNNHIFYHEEDKMKFQYDICKVKFSFESQLKRHGSMHKDDKPFTCASKKCPKFLGGFKSQQALNRHMEIHRGNMIKCDVQGCPKSFPTHHYLCDHKNTNHGMPYEHKHVLDSYMFTCKSRKTQSDHHKLYYPFNSDGSDAN